MIDLAAYDPSWPQAFEAEARTLREALGQAVRSIEHVGSTAVPAMVAKPVIDIQVALVSLAPVREVIQALARLGYTHVPLGNFDLVYPYFEKPRDWPHTHHLHLCAAGPEQERVHLVFRDYLRDHPDVATRYAALKRRLARDLDVHSLASRERYSLSKTSFVEAVLAAAAAEGYRSGAPGGSD